MDTLGIGLTGFGPQQKFFLFIFQIAEGGMSFNAQPPLCVNDPIAVMYIIITHFNKTFETENIGSKDNR